MVTTVGLVPVSWLSPFQCWKLADVCDVQVRQNMLLTLFDSPSPKRAAAHIISDATNSQILHNTAATFSDLRKSQLPTVFTVC